MSETASRSLYWDMIKGLGILAIVLGHCSHGALTAFVYLFHLAVFFFVTGFLFKEDKYGNAPFTYLGIRLAGVWPRYMFYILIYVLIHNFAVRQGVYAGQPIYNHTDMLTVFCTGMAFSSPEPVCGALWFVPVWLVSSALFCGTVWLGRTLSARLGQPRLRMAVTVCACLVLGAAGLLLTMRKRLLAYYLHIALLVVPIYLAAWLVRTYCPRFRRYTTWYGCIISAVLLSLVNRRLHIFMDLVNMDIPGIGFFPISLLGIYFTLSLGALLEKTPLVKIMAFFGRHSFDIMALHVTVFKMLDLAYTRLFLDSVPDALTAIPAGFPQELALLYPLFGMTVPALLGWCLNRLKQWWRQEPSARV